MSPEQVEGKTPDHRSDIFSLGVILYEMATGQRPFKGDSSASVLSSILTHTPPSVGDIKEKLPSELGRIIRHALVKDRERRYQTAADLRNELEELKQDLDSGALVVVRAREAGPAREPPGNIIHPTDDAAWHGAISERIARWKMGRIPEQ